MDMFKDLMKKSKSHELALILILIAYILLNVETPHFLAKLIDNLYGNIILLVITIYVFSHSNPVLGIVLLVAVYELINRSGDKTGTAAIKRFMPTELTKSNDLNAFNQFPVTLEEEVVKKMAPLVETNGPYELDYKPDSPDLHDAVNIHNEQSII